MVKRGRVVSSRRVLICKAVVVGAYVQFCLVAIMIWALLSTSRSTSRNDNNNLVRCFDSFVTPLAHKIRDF